MGLAKGPVAIEKLDVLTFGKFVVRSRGEAISIDLRSARRLLIIAGDNIITN